MRKGLLSVLVALVMSTAITSAQQQSAVAPEIKRVSERFVAAFNARDAAALASLYAEDAIVMPPSAPMVKGRSAIQKMFQGQMDAGVTLKLVPFAASISGRQGVEVGTSVVTMKAGAGPATTSPGKYVVIYTRVGNEWKMLYDIFNSDQAAGAP